ncbi:MAG: hypothetical protein NTW97_00050 [Candidatus Krumholzibacteria bacterium]|nr:hypothetical protein [Candidatus Krumholzibacteria bacterium]
MRRFIIGTCLVLLVSPSASHAAKYAGEFMALGGGARAMGMGGTFIAVANDATTTFWNPAGLVDVSSRENRGGWEAVLMHAEQFGDLIDYNFFSAAFPIKPGESAWGISIIHMGIPDIPVILLKPGMITNSDGDDVYEPYGPQAEGLNLGAGDIRYESANDVAALVSYAQRFRFGSAGANVKIIRNDQITGVSSFGIGLDLGLLKREAWRDLAVGVKLQDATGTYIGWSTGEREFIYPALKLGCAYPFRFEGMGSTVVLAVDGDFRYENRRGAAQFWIGSASVDFHLGAEILIRDIVALRGGLDMGRPTAGMGIMLRDFGPWGMSLGLDYALLHHDEFDMTHRVSLIAAR